jgi:hypothetical protein
MQAARIDAGLAPARLAAGSLGRALPGSRSGSVVAPHGCSGCRIAGARGPSVNADIKG